MPLSRAYLLLVLTTLFWAGNWVIARAIHDMMSPVAMAFWRWLLALLILAPFIAGPLRREWPLIRASWKPLGVLGVLGVGAFNTLAYTGLNYTTATNGVLLNSITPVLIVAVGLLFLGERLDWRRGAGVAVSLAGVLAIVGRGDLDTLLGLHLNPGDLWVLAAVIAWTAYTVCLRWRPPRLSSRAFTGVLIVIGVAALLPLFAWDLAHGRPTAWNAATLASVVYFAVFPSVLAYFFWNAAVARVGAERAGLFLHLLPLFGAVLSMLFLGESLHGFHLVGAALIFCGLFVATRDPGAGHDFKARARRV
jgi:drug/metabolite transporter (DMT)-like permease